MYHMLYNDIAGENTTSRYHCTESFTIKVRTLLYYVYTTVYNQINWNCPCVLIMNFYRLVQFHTGIRFHTSLYVRVSDSGHSVMYVRKFCTDKPSHKIYCWISVQSTQHHTPLHNPTIIHMKIVLRQPFTGTRYTAVYHHTPHNTIRFYTILGFYIRRHFFAPACHPCNRIPSTSKYD